MNKQPLISFIIPCYNQGSFLDESLQSVYNQTYENWECIIVNDGSTDNSETIIKTWVKKDVRFKYFLKANGGVSSARNLALENITGNYIQFLDADDVLESTKLKQSLKLFEKSNDQNETMVISNFKMFANNLKTTTAPYCKLYNDLFTFENLLYKWNETFSIPIHCGFFKTKIFKSTRFPENLTAQEDWMVWVKLFKNGNNAIFLDEPLALYRQNLESRMMTKSMLKDQIEAYKYLKNVITEDEFYKLSIILISRYYKTQEVIKHRLRVLKKSKPYQTGLMIKKTLKILGLLQIAKKIFPFFLKFKA